MRLVGHGHPAIRATHTKTLEFSSDHDITERATCVVAVDVAPAAAPIAGPVRITVRAGDEAFALTGRGNPSWDPAGPAVVRRSPLRLPGTLATHASAAARDLPTALVTALRDPAARVEIDVDPIDGPPCAVLFALDADRVDNTALAAELAVADVVAAEDDAAARLVGQRVAAGDVAVTGRTLVLASCDLPGRTVAAALWKVDVETIGLSPRLAAAAASPSRGPVLLAPDDADARDVLRATPAASRVVVRMPAERLAGFLQLAADLRGTGTGTAVQPYAPPVRVAAAEPTRLASNDDVYLCLDAAPLTTALDPAVRAAVENLLADGVATRTVAKALAALTGWDRRRAYNTVLNWEK